MQCSHGTENQLGWELKEHSTLTNPLFKPSDLPSDSCHLADGGASLSTESHCNAYHMPFESEDSRNGKNCHVLHEMLRAQVIQVNTVPDGFLPLELGGHGLDHLAAAEVAIDAALIQFLVIFPAL